LTAQFAAVLTERNRIAREIHDTLAQSFVGIGVQLETVAKLQATSPDEARRRLDRARILVRSSLADSRRTVA
jgi:signal transduction histidine kinase